MNCHIFKSGVVAAKQRLAITITMGSKDYSGTALDKYILTKSKRVKEKTWKTKPSFGVFGVLRW
ncbi:MAG: hypothetical protein PHY48_10875 [Candidatus Cloacimonetes bacterium]|nr:hypothetical protein [Candidatus Cloacimonadota bacterium]